MKNWLDRAYSFDPELWGLSASFVTAHIDPTPYTDGTPYNWVNYTYPQGATVTPDNFTYSERPGLVPRNNSVGNLGSSLIYAVEGALRGKAKIKAFPVEASVDGLLTYLLSWSLPSHSEYSMPYDQISEQFRLGPPHSFP